MEGDVISMQELFLYEQHGVGPDGKVLGRFRPGGIRPKFADVLQARGLELAGSLFLDLPGDARHESNGNAPSQGARRAWS
jgi:hypothetical protein